LVVSGSAHALRNKSWVQRRRSFWRVRP